MTRKIPNLENGGQYLGGMQRIQLDFMVGFLYDVFMAYKDPNDERAKEARRKHYRKNKEVYRANAKKRRLEMQQYVWSVKSKPCMDCGNQYLGWVMQLDHRPEEAKVANISALIVNGSWPKLLEEIDKCDVVCANCHILRTASRAGWQLDAVIFENPEDAFSTFPKKTSLGT